MTASSSRFVVTRRGFLGTVGAVASGLALGLYDGRVRKVRAAAPEAVAGWVANAFMRIEPDGTVVIVCARSELGQGVRSALPMLMADELGADLTRVHIEQGDGDKKYGDQNTDGSTSVRKRYLDLRRIAASARMMLVAAAASRWKVGVGECDATDHAVHHRSSGRSEGFGELVADAAKQRVPSPEQVKLRPDDELRYVGKPSPMVDGPDIVAGRAIFGADVKLAGTLVAVVARPPDVGGTLGRYDADAAMAVPGVVKVVEMPAPDGAPGSQPLGGVAVVARDTWAALLGRKALAPEWKPGPNAGYSSSVHHQELLANVRAPGKSVRTTGDIDRALASAARVVSAEYLVPHLAHAPMEPPSATASVTADGCEVWAATQHPQGVISDIAKMLGMKPERVTCHVTLVGGAFGRKSINDFASEAAFLSKSVGKPVRLQWTREDDLQHDYYHPLSAQRLEAALDAAGKVIGWRHRTAFPSIRSAFDASADGPSVGDVGQGVLDIPLDVPNVRAETGKARAGVRIGWLRSVCNIHHGFAQNCFIDELAEARGQDMKTVLLEVLGPARLVTPEEAGVEKIPNYSQPLSEHPIDVGRHRKVIERVAAMAGWGAPQKAGRALGLAAHRSFLTSVGVVAAVEKRDNAVGWAVDEVWVVVDAGVVLNLDRVIAQMEGAVLFGMSIALHGEISLKAGRVQQTNFRDYRLTRIGEAPRAVHVEVVKSRELPGGIGEPGVPPVAPAIANAYFALTGTRVRSLPMLRPA